MLKIAICGKRLVRQGSNRRAGQTGAGGMKGGMQEILTALRAAGEATRLRLLFILSHGEFNVTELTRILGQSQPRISRHLKLMSEAGLLERYKEGSWVLFRAHEEGPAGRLAREISRLLSAREPPLSDDLRKLRAILNERAERAMAYFASVAEEWDTIRSLHVSEAQVEEAMLEMAGPGPFRFLLDVGTGTGRVLELFAPRARHAVGVDSSREMLAVARARLEAAGLKQAQVRAADACALPLEDGLADFVTVHQVLHFLNDPAAAIAETARVMAAGGRLLVADFAPHDLEFLREEHAHRRLGVSRRDMERWLARAGLVLRRHRYLKPPDDGQARLTVSLWLAEKP